MGSFIDITGKKFGRLTATEIADRVRAPSGLLQLRWRCLCDCGNESVVRGADLRRTDDHCVRSCGCIRIERPSQLRHGMSGTPLHNAWASMCGRYYIKTNTSYDRYGARGITVCDEWLHSPEAFMEWALAHGYKKELQIDRINNMGNYEPSNCRFVTAKENANNRRPRRWWKKPEWFAELAL